MVGLVWVAHIDVAAADDGSDGGPWLNGADVLRNGFALATWQ